MKKHRRLRNIGIIAHVDAGKTTTTERILYYTGNIHTLGNIDDGNTVTDSDHQEASRGITISSSSVSANWNYNEKTYQINIIDTPGHIDFSIEVERSLRVLDGAVALFCASSGVEPQSETVWSQSDKYNIPKICFINKMDRIGADYFKVVSDIEVEFNVSTLPLQIPIGEGDDFEGVIDLLKEKALYWNSDNHGNTWETKDIPDHLKPLADKWRTILIETISNFDETIMLKYLSNDIISTDILNEAIREITSQQKAVPILCGSAYKNIGVQPVLDAVINYLPSPEDIAYIEGINRLSNEKVRIRCTREAQLTAFVFKVITDKYFGKLAMVRLYSGHVNVGSTILNSRTNLKNRVSRILKIHADKHTELNEAQSGDIVALIGLKDVKTGDALSQVNMPFSLENIEVLDPVISLAIEPKSKNDEKHFGEALAKILAEDPSLQVAFDKQTGQTLLQGMGELHLEVRLERLRSDFGIQLNKGNPKVSYRELLTQDVEHTEVFKKQTGGTGHFAQISFILGPRRDQEKGLEFVSEIKGGVIPKEFIPNVKKGFLEAMSSGVLAGYPLESMRVILIDGKIHDEDSSALDFETVARNGFKKAAVLAKPELLEPVMNAEISCPEDYLGNVTSDVSKRRGVITAIKENGIKRIVSAEVPLIETFGYISALRTLTSGRGSVTLQLLKYRKVPERILDQIGC
ncbi:elongation factor G [uncultured Psychroserpens sp.]|uniref:elongation factor G n=1 Tax=uncultured Psychroserpens sp. TaxID=255436 RepID=UPI00261D68D9|nr:elongation factor G [uncultured Psychroserpens sp.]